MRLDADHTNPCNTPRFVEYGVICVIVQRERESVGLGVRVSKLARRQWRNMTTKYVDTSMIQCLVNTQHSLGGKVFGHLTTSVILSLCLKSRLDPTGTITELSQTVTRYHLHLNCKKRYMSILQTY